MDDNKNEELRSSEGMDDRSELTLLQKKVLRYQGTNNDNE
jgi:hypothetical protein